MKHVGWHDESENATGILGSVLATDVQTLNGVSTEVLSVMMEAMASIFGGIVISFIFTWKVALVSLACSPFLVIGGVIGAMFDKDNAGGSDSNKEMVKNTDKNEKKSSVQSPELLANDAINNYRTIAGFSLQKGIVDEYCELL